jgi:hypothetical protein
MQKKTFLNVIGGIGEKSSEWFNQQKLAANKC